MKVVSHGIYLDMSTKGRIGGRHHAYRAEVRVDGVRRRARFLSYSAAQKWLKKWKAQDTEIVALLEEREKRRAERERLLDSERIRKAAERVRAKTERIVARMVAALGVPFDRLCRRAEFKPCEGRFDDVMRMRVAAVMRMPIQNRWKFAKHWTTKERDIAHEIDRKQRCVYNGGEEC